jgi:hypothetical protein
LKILLLREFDFHFFAAIFEDANKIWILKVVALQIFPGEQFVVAGGKARQSKSARRVCLSAAVEVVAVAPGRNPCPD